MADQQPLVLLYPSNVSPVVLQLVLRDPAHRARVKMQGVGAKNCPVAQLKVNAVTGDVLFGEIAIAQYLCRVFNLSSLLASSDPFLEVEVQQWLAYAAHLSHSSEDDYARALKDINGHLAHRSVLVGYAVTLADMAVWGELFRRGFSGEEGELPHLKRFFRFCNASPLFDEVAKEVQKEPAKEKEKERGNAFLQLKGNPQKGKVVTRFPPEPSGYLHVGHCKAAMLNHHYAQSYGGKLIIRMDDTNPSNEKEEFTNSILSDLKALEIKGDKYTHTSDYFDYIIECCEKLIRKGLLYVDESTAEDIQKMREKREPSPFRDRPVKESLALWELMKEGTSESTKYVVRAKIDYANDNGCLRDPNMFRVVLNVPHPRTGTKYKVYPLYDFACPIVDSLEGVTHSLRSSEYHDRNALYEWVLNANEFAHKPIIEDFSRLNFTHTVLSKRKLNWFVKEGLVEGWDDPCFPTVRGMMRQGLTVDALRKFILQQGSSKNLNLMDISKLWVLNKQILDPIVPRYVAVVDPVIVHLDFNSREVRTRELHKKNPSLGKKVVDYSNEIVIDREDADGLQIGEEVTLMDWGNVIVNDVKRGDDQRVIAIDVRLHLEGDFKKTKKKLTWIGSRSEDTLGVELVDCLPLLTKPKLEKETKDKPADKMEDFIPPQLKIRTIAVGEPALRMLYKGDKIQLERKGYFICDRAWDSLKPEAGPLVLIKIPDGSRK